MNELIIAFIRTSVPYLVGAVIAWLTVRGISVDATAVTGLTAFLTSVFGQLYYLIARFIESRVPQYGWLLGVAKQPSYQETK